MPLPLAPPPLLGLDRMAVDTLDLGGARRWEGRGRGARNAMTTRTEVRGCVGKGRRRGGGEAASLSVGVELQMGSSCTLAGCYQLLHRKRKQEEHARDQQFNGQKICGTKCHVDSLVHAPLFGS